MVLFNTDRWARRVMRLALIGALLTSATQAVAEEHLFVAQVFLDRALPDRAVFVFDFRVNEASGDAGGVQYLLLHSGDGTFKVPFDLISEIIINRSLGWSSDTAHYDATVKLKQGRRPRTGRLDLRVLRGSVDSIPWHVLLTTRDDCGADLHRIVFIE